MPDGDEQGHSPRATNSTLVIERSDLSGEMVLPPSKSHAMRWITLASMDENPTTITMNEIGEDVAALLESLQLLGIGWDGKIMKGGRIAPSNENLDCKNSGTALRFLIGQVSTMDGETVLFGDSSLQVRSSLPLLECLGIDYQFVGENHLPVKVKGSFSKNEITVPTSESSQFLSSVLLMTPRTEGFQLSTSGKSVSRKHSELTWELCKITGATEKGVPWDVNCPDVVIPPDPSMLAFCELAGLRVANKPGKSDGIEHNTSNYDLTDSNDLITPLAAILALGDGGQIKGASHAALKESNRILRTKDLLNQFSMSCEATSDGLIIEGNQKPVSPNSIVNTFGDHRIQMTAIVLASLCGAEIDSSELHRIAWPSFLEQLIDNGLQCRIVN